MSFRTKSFLFVILSSIAFVISGLWIGYGGDINKDLGTGGIQIGGGIALSIISFIAFIATLAWFYDGRLSK